MSNKHLFPTKEEEFDSFFYALILYLFGTVIPNIVTPAAGPNATRLGISAAYLDDIWQLFNQWADIYKRATDDLTSTKPLIKKKNDLIIAIQEKLREIYGDIPKSKLTVDDRTVTRLKERDDSPSRTPRSDHSPDLEIEEVKHLEHTLRITDPENPDSRKMPEGQKVNIAIGIGAPDLPEDQIPFTQNQVVTKAFHDIIFQAADKGKTVYYQCCYENAHNEKGPKSLVKSTVIM